MAAVGGMEAMRKDGGKAEAEGAGKSGNAASTRARGQQQAKKAAPAKPKAGSKPSPVLPHPLTESSLLVAIADLPDGARRAAETCYQCFKESKFTPSDFVSFLKSISNQAPALQKLFADKGSKQNAAKSSSGYSGSTGLKDLFDLNTPGSLSNILASRPGQALRNHEARSRGRGGEPVEAEEKIEEAVDMTAKLISRRRREAKRRQLGKYPGNETQRWKRYLLDIVRRLGKALPASGKKKLQLAIQAYCERSLTPEEFQETLQNLVDEHAITIALEYTPEHEARIHKSKHMYGMDFGSTSGSGSKRQWPQANPEPRKKPKTEAVWPRPTKQEESTADSDSAMGSEDGMPSIATEPSSPGCPACELGMFGSQGSNGRCQSCGKLYLAEQAKQQSPRLSGAGNPDFGSTLMSSELPEDPLACWLTQQARRVCPPERNVVVKVLAQEKHRTGGTNSMQYPYGMKAIFAFQKIGGREVMVIGMYVHEFGSDAPAPAGGRVYLECIDSIPLHGGEQSDERQQLLTSVINGYLKFAARKGMKTVHLRVPPPSAENSYIFAYRNLSIRIEATLRMTKWYKRILDTAKGANIVSEYQACSHLSRLSDFPPCILSSADLTEEHAFSAMRSTVSKLQADCEDNNEASVLSKIVSFQDRFFVAKLRTPDAGELMMMDEWSLFKHRPSVVAGSRLDFIATCAREKLSFNTLQDTHRATAILLRLMMPSEDQSPRCVEDILGIAGTEPSKEAKPADMVQNSDVKTEAEDETKMKAEPTIWDQQERDELLSRGAEDTEACWEAAAADLGGLADAEVFADSLFSA